MASIASKLLLLHERLSNAGIEHAFGGAIALAYWTANPRGTIDIDVNVFVPATEADRVLAALPHEIPRDRTTIEEIERNGQIRLWWGKTPVDLFFSYEPLHDEAARNRRTVPFEGTEIPVLGPVELAVFKVMFNRTQDWADIEAMLRAGHLDLDDVRDHMAGPVGDDEQRIGRLEEARRRATS